MPRSVQHWPGGIPRCIKPHPETDLSLDQIKEEVKGWLLFVQENWVPAANTDASNDGKYELHQRRHLLEKWASATQELRDSYQSRAPIPEGLQYPAEALAHIYDTLQPGDTNGLVSIAPLDEAHAANRERWVKFAILLYNYDIDTGHCLLNNYMPSEAILNPETTASPSIEDFLSWEDLETANFISIYLTHTGTVLNYGYTGPYMLVDEEGLRTGRLTMVEYEINGTVKDTLHIRPFNMRMPYTYASTLGKGLDEIRHVQGAYIHQNLPLDMDLLIIDILCQAKAADQLPQTMNLSYREQWMEDVELYAPGYLALEAEGRAGEYSLHCLTDPESVDMTRKTIWNRLQANPNLFAPNFQFQGKVQAAIHVSGKGQSKHDYACFVGLVAPARVLISKGADVNAQGGKHGNALQAASEGGYQESVKLLLDKGADFNAQGGLYGNVLYAASSKGHQEIVKLLLDKGRYYIVF